jgi:hypothetical protein
MAVRPSPIPAALGPGPTLPRPLRRLAGCGGCGGLLQPGLCCHFRGSLLLPSPPGGGSGCLLLKFLARRHLADAFTLHRLLLIAIEILDDERAVFILLLNQAAEPFPSLVPVSFHGLTRLRAPTSATANVVIIAFVRGGSLQPGDAGVRDGRLQRA